MFSFLPYIIRSLVYVTVMAGWYYGIWVLAIPLTVWYVFRYRAYELCLVGLLLDIQFYTGNFIPYYGISACILVLVVRMIVPIFRSRTIS